MAVYKPTNCQPYLATFDLVDCVNDGTPTLFECKVDTSNAKVTAYAITIYNSDNTQIFPVDANDNPVEPQDNISFVSDLLAITGASSLMTISSVGYINLNTGVNGSYLHIPFFTSDPFSGSSVNYNALLVSSTESGVVVTASSRAQNGGMKTVTIENGQQYKWVITLFQGVVTDDGSDTPIFPKSIYEYDMVITTGQVMGSNIERIQSYLSNEIYIDYYVQPVLLTYNESVSSDITTPVTIHILDEINGTWVPQREDGTTIPWNSVNVEMVGDRVLIKNYDSSYGYIYPTTGDYGFSEGLITKGQANAFQIYSMSNNEEDLTTVRMVSVVPYSVVPWTWINMEGSQGSSYGQQVYYVVDTQNSIPSIFYPFETSYQGADGGVLIDAEAAVQNRFIQNGTGNIGITSQTRIVLNYQASANTVDNEGEVLNWYANQIQNMIPNFENGSFLTVANCGTETVASPFNGIFAPTFSVDSRIQIGEQYYRKVTVNWYRVSDADAWGELSTKIVKVTSTYPDSIAKYGGQNIQTQKYDSEGVAIDDSTVAGTLNLTPLKFIEEKPLPIYSHTLSPSEGDSLINTIGIIFYNDEPNISNGANDQWPQNQLATLYIRPNIGIEPEMWIRELGISESVSRFFLIKEVNTTTWAVKYNPYEVYVGKTISNDSVSDNAVFNIGQRYQIRSFYKSSDENPFNLYGNPVLTLTFGTSDSDAWDSGGSLISGNTEYTENSDYDAVVIASRSFTVSCDYWQDQNILWKSFNYTLYDIVGNQVGTSGDSYDGFMMYTFYGLRNSTYYDLTLTVETYAGNVFSLTQRLYCYFVEENVEGSFPFELYFDCDINAARASFLLTGYIVPNVDMGNEYRVVLEDGTNTDPAISGVTYNTSGDYMMIRSGVPEEGVTYTHVSDGTTTVLSINELETQDDSILIQSSHVVQDSGFAGNFVCAYIDLDSETAGTADNYKLLIYIPDEYVADVYGDNEPNTNRNKVMYDVIFASTGSSAIGGEKVAMLINLNTGAQFTDNQWRSNLSVLPEWQTSLVAATNMGSSSYVVYKPIDQVPVGNGTTYKANAAPVNGPFNTTTRLITYENGGSTVDTQTSWWAVSPQTQINPLVSDMMNTTMFQTDYTIDINGTQVVCGFITSDGENFKSRTTPDDDSNPNYFTLINKAPILWGDYNFVVETSSSHDSAQPVAITGLNSSSDISDGYMSLTYYENRTDPFVWQDEVGGVITRWVDGCGYNNGANDGQIYVGNQQQVIDTNLTNSERSPINGKTFVINAHITTSDVGTITADTVSVTVYTTL